jgi:hypothetical protein
MPSHARVVEVKIAEAVLLADLYEIVSDLDAAGGLCDRVFELGQRQSRDYSVEEGLVTAAVVKYGRCFTSGVRLSLKFEDLASISADMVLAHEYFLALRHKFIAHAVNAFEETYVTTTASVRDGQMMPVTSVHPGQVRMILTAETAASLSELIEVVREVVKARIWAEEAKVLAHIQALPIEVVHSWDLHTPRAMQSGDVHDARDRGFHARKRCHVWRHAQASDDRLPDRSG